MTTAAQYAARLASQAKIFRRVAERYPSAEMDTLWDNGPMVPVIDGDDETWALVDTVRCHLVNGDPHLFASVMLEFGDERVALFVRQSRWLSGAYANVVLDRLKTYQPSTALTALVRVMRSI